MDLKQLQALVQVVQTGSFTKAADRLGSQKAQVSRSISALERHLGVSLLKRSTRALSLTEIGQEIYQRAVGILGAIEATQAVAQRVQAQPAGLLRLTCGVEFGQIAVSDWIARYLQRYPQVNVDAEYTGRLVDLVHEGFDLAIRIGPLSDSTLSARQLGRLEYGLYAAPHFLHQMPSPAHPQDLNEQPLLVFSGGRRARRWTLHRAADSISIALQPRLRLNNGVALALAAEQGLGICKLPQRVAASAVREGRLLRLLSDWQLPSVPVHAVFPSDRYLTPKLRSFIDLAVECFSADGAGTTTLRSEPA